MVDKENIESISGLAAMQKGMFFSYAVDTESDAYVEQFDFTATGEVNVDHLRAALAATSRHYGVLRTVFSFRNTDDPYQVVLKERAPSLDVLDYRGEASVDQMIEQFKEADRARGFDLGADVLIRATAIRVDDRRWHLVITFHHIILDGWSLGPLFGTLFGYYDELVRTGSVRQRHETQAYRGYIDWYEQQHTEDARRHWADVLDGYEKAAGLPRHRRADGYQGATHRFTLSGDLYARMKEFAQQAQVTQSAVFQAAWGVVLQTFAYTDDVVFGNVVSGRSIALAGIEDMVGLFVNTQPVRVTTRSGMAFADLCRDVQDAYRRSNPYEYYPLYEIQGATPLKSDLLDHVVAFENYPLSEQLRHFGADDDEGLRLDGVEVFERTTYDFHVVVNPGADFGVTFTYNANVYTPALMRTLERCLVAVIATAVDNPSVLVGDIAVWDERAEAPVAVAGRSAPSALPAESLIDIVTRTTEANGDKTALMWQGRRYSYRDIARWSDAIAWRLRELDVEPGTGVGVLIDRRPELIVAILGLLKNGNFYVPIDTKDAAPRIEHVLGDADVRHVCTVSGFEELIPASIVAVSVDEQVEDVPAFPCHRSEPDAVAYLMYTSGSTGQPKGCHITHRNIQRLVVDQTYADFGDEQVVLQTSSPAFDAFTWEMWGTVLHGGTLVLPDDELDILDGDRLRQVIEEHRVSSMWLTSPLFNQLCEHDPGIFASLGHLLVGGSALSIRHIATVRAACQELRITNGYGPTENTTFSTTHEIRPEDLSGERIPIGRPLNHSTAHVLDRGLHLAPPGAIGELCVGGAGVSLGYHRRPELTRARFVTVPQLPGERLYRTGDLVRWRPDGTLDYLGRIDDQVKINGFRVEVGEVEAAMRSLDQITDAVVIAVEADGEKRLHGYFVAAGPLSTDVVRAELAATMAGYLVPAVLTRVDAIPLTKNGKVDHRRLAELRTEPDADSPRPDLRHLSEMERVLHDIVADVLSAPDVDIHRNFFDIGINSLNLLAINNRVRKAQGKDLALTVFFEHTSISSLAAYLDRGGSDDRAPDDALAAADEEAAIMTSQLLRQLVDEPEGSLDNA